MDRLEKTLYKKWEQYQSAVGEACIVLQVSIDFEFTLFFQPGDGFVIEHEAKNAPLTTCLKIIKKKGVLTLEDYLRICI